MSIKQAVKALQITAMKAKDKETLATARMITSAIGNAEIDARTKNKELTDSDIMATLRSMIKSRQDSIALYEKAGATDRVQAEQNEINVIKMFLPESLSRDEMIAIISPIAEKIKAGEMKSGPAMGFIKKAGGDRIDMGEAKKILDELTA